MVSIRSRRTPWTSSTRSSRWCPSPTSRPPETSSQPRSLLRAATTNNKSRGSRINNKRNRIIQMISNIWIRYNRRSNSSKQLLLWAWLSSRKRLKRGSRTYSKSTVRSRRIRSRSWPFNTNRTHLLRGRRVNKTLMLKCPMMVVAAKAKKKRRKVTKNNLRIRGQLAKRNSKIRGSIKRLARSSSSKRSRV